MITDASGWPTLELSRLYKLEPIGIGTSLVESLSGYVTRLALEHLVSTTNLTKYIVSPLLSHVLLRPDNMLIGSYKSVTTMNGNNRSADAWVDALEQLTTRNDLSRLTLIPFVHMFSGNDLLRPVKRWCPCCLEEWMEKGLTLYEPLLWCISLVEVCPLHKEPLVSNCPHCNGSSTILTPRSMPGFCHNCEEWLGRSSNLLQSSECTEHQIWAAQEIWELIESGSSVIGDKNEGLPAVLNFLITKRIKRDGERSTAKLIGVSPKKMYKWLSGEKLPTLDQLLRLCWLFKLKLAELETQIVSLEKDGGFDERVAAVLNESFLRRSKVDWMKIEKLLLDVISGNVPPKRVCEIARDNGCHSEHIYNRYSELCKDVTAKCARYRQEQRLLQI